MEAHHTGGYMHIIKPSHKILAPLDANAVYTGLALLESAGRTSYLSWERQSTHDVTSFFTMIRQRTHDAVTEFGPDIYVHFIADRGMTHEQVRHRLASYVQESTRYCNYSKGRYGAELTFCEQPFVTAAGMEIWLETIAYLEKQYMRMLDAGEPAQLARSVLPISLKAEITVKANPREWRHIFNLRCHRAAHPIIRGVMRDLLRELCAYYPVAFDDLAQKYLDIERPLWTDNEFWKMRQDEG